MEITFKQFADDNKIELPKKNTWEYSDIFLKAYKDCESEVQNNKRYYKLEDLERFFKENASLIDSLIQFSHDDNLKRKRMISDAVAVIILEE